MYGIMQTGWQNVNGNWYYLNSKGAMQTGWLFERRKILFPEHGRNDGIRMGQLSGQLVLLQKPDGDMLTNAYAPDGRYVNAEGVLIQ